MRQINKKIDGNFPTQVQAYIKDIFLVVDKIGITLISMVLFGSLAKGGYKEDISDVDLILIISNKHTRSQKAKLDGAITFLEFKHGFREKSDSKIDFAYQIAENMTGMFISHFICYEQDFLQANFAKVFHVNPILSKLLAPSAIVWNSVLISAKTIWGQNLLGRTKPFPIRPYHIIKSMLMNSLLNILAYATYTLHTNSTKFSMEAVKWTLHSCYFCLEKRSTSVEEAASYFQGKNLNYPFVRKFYELRENYQSSSNFIWRAIKVIINIHLYTLKEMYQPGDSL